MSLSVCLRPSCGGCYRRDDDEALRCHLCGRLHPDHALSVEPRRDGTGGRRRVTAPHVKQATRARAKPKASRLSAIAASAWN